jgi:hypothetical protein
MANLGKDLITLRNPLNIKNSMVASSPYVLRRIFVADPVIKRLIKAGEKVIPLITEELNKSEHLDEITLSALAFIIENVKVVAAPELLGALFRKHVKNPGPFFIHFAAHAIRSAFRLPIKSLEIVYSRIEIIETEDKLH